MKVPVFFNGKFIGYHENPEEFVEKLREKRRKGEVNYELNVVYDKLRKEVRINTDRGRVRKPYLVLEGGSHKLTPELIQRIKDGKVVWEDLLKEGVIEYLDADEEDTAYVAIHENETTPEHTHLEIDPSTIFGVVAGLLPYPEYNSSPRITMACSMAKQSLGIYASNFNMRFDTRAYMMYYPQVPLVQTRAYSTLKFNRRAAGQNFVVAVVSYRGWNMSDAVVINKSAIERGMARTVFFKTYETEERRYPGGQRDRIEVPAPSVMGYLGDEAYRNLDEDGIIFPESEVKGRDVLVGKTAPPRFMEEVSLFGILEEKKRESSLMLKPSESGKVDAVAVSETLSGLKSIKVRIRMNKIPEIGDKFASRHGQKGVIGMVLPQEDMPFTESGIIPDLLLNPHAIPSRMTAGHVLEMLGGKWAALKGEIVDGTAFSGDRAEKFTKDLKAMGFEEYGEEWLYDGITGQRIKAKIFVGVVYYQRLHHLVSNKMHMRARGPIQLLTHQPTEGRSKEGGLRFGEMERDCLIGYGAALTLKERLFEESDKTELLVCPKCGSIGYYSKIKNQQVCPICGPRKLEKVEISYAFKLLVDEIKAMGIFPRLILGDKA